jgi:RNA polymerase sigma factor (sigma-70 family)
VRREPVHFVEHLAFAEPGAEGAYGPGGVEELPEPGGGGHMPDEATRDCARRMHYAAYRWRRAGAAAEGRGWRAHYFALRNRIVVGNRKLVFRAVQKGAAGTPLADDLAGDCLVVLIGAVAAYNPWMGIRFSTYAFTCLLRALGRLRQRLAGDRLLHAVPLDEATAGAWLAGRTADAAPPLAVRLDRLLSEEHGLLTGREKIVLRERFCLAGGERATLEQVGHSLGLSKERVRQLQTSALGKLRATLREAAAC